MIKQNLGGSFLAKPCFRSAQEVHLESRAQRRVVDLSAQQKGSMERTPDPAERAASGATPPVNDGAAHQTAKHFIVKLGVDMLKEGADRPSVQRSAITFVHVRKPYPASHPLTPTPLRWADPPTPRRNPHPPAGTPTHPRIHPPTNASTHPRIHPPTQSTHPPTAVIFFFSLPHTLRSCWWRRRASPAWPRHSTQNSRRHGLRPATRPLSPNN